jgi:hypothetical protein
MGCQGFLFGSRLHLQLLADGLEAARQLLDLGGPLGNVIAPWRVIVGEIIVSGGEGGSSGKAALLRAGGSPFLCAPDF